jgi:carbon storage regulator
MIFGFMLVFPTKRKISERLMEIVNIDFETSLTLDINGERILITPFKERDPNVIKLGIDAPRSITVNREEVQQQLQNQDAE